MQNEFKAIFFVFMTSCSLNGSKDKIEARLDLTQKNASLGPLIELVRETIIVHREVVKSWIYPNKMMKPILFLPTECYPLEPNPS